MAEEVDGVGDKGPGDTTTIDVETLSGTFLENFWTYYFPQLLKYQDFWSISIQIKEIAV
jgi:hypothetical protein